MWIGVALSLVFTALRTGLQYNRNRKFYSNDFFILFAMLCHIVTASVYQVAMPPMYEIAYVSAKLRPPAATFFEDANFFLRLQFALDLLLWTTSWAVKFSLLFFFWRLFDSVNSPMRIFWSIMCVITAASYIGCIILQTFACDPIQHFFTLGTHCPHKQLPSINKKQVPVPPRPTFTIRILSFSFLWELILQLIASVLTPCSSFQCHIL